MSALSEDAYAAKLPSPPFVRIAGIPNFRDLGGWPVSKSSNYSIRKEIIYRCGAPSKIKQDGITTLQRLGVTHIYDLRSAPEIKKAQDAGRGGVVEWEGCERVFAPVFSNKDYSPESLAVRYKDYATSGTEVNDLASLLPRNHTDIEIYTGVYKSIY